jgi:predicted small lipoprotein YifL
MRQFGPTALALLIALAACGAPAPTPSPSPPAPTPAPTAVLATSAEQIIGTWLGIGKQGMYQQFNADGTWWVAAKLESLPSKPDAELTYRFEGTQFILTEVKATALEACGAKTAIYQVELLASGNIKFVKVNEACVPRGRTTAQEHRRVR